MIESICKQRMIPLAYSTKAVYEIYFFSLTVDLKFSPPPRPRAPIMYLFGSPCGDTGVWIEYSKTRAAFTKKRDSYISKTTKRLSSYSDYKVNPPSFTIYFSNRDDLVSAIDTLSPNCIISKAVAPRSEAILEFMRDGVMAETSKVYRQKPFFGKFYYRVKLKRAWGDDRETILSRMTNLFSGEVVREDHNNSPVMNYSVFLYSTYHLEFNEERARYNNSDYVYIRDEDDIFLLKMAIGENIEKVEELVIVE